MTSTARNRTRPGLNKRLLQRHAFRARFLDEIAQHNDVTHDHAGQTNDAEQGHETERRVRHRQPEKRADQTQRHGQQDDDRFATELNCRTMASAISVSEMSMTLPISDLAFLQLLVFARDLEVVAGRQLDRGQRRAGRGPEWSEESSPAGRVGIHGHGAELVVMRDERVELRLDLDRRRNWRTAPAGWSAL